MRIELTIKTDYLPSWGFWEGVRELLQNGRDAEVEFSAPLTVRYRKDTQTLVIENEGSVLPHEALLLGFTSKGGRSDQIGKFGEGLKLGTLALVRRGHTVKIRSGSEVWTPSIEQSDKFNARVLTFDIQGGRKDEARVQVEIGGVPEEAWDAIKDRFLWLQKKQPDVAAKTECGSLLASPKHIGKIYVKGIFVQEGPYAYGYDLLDVDIDRDRKMLNAFDLSWKLCRLWREALTFEPALVSDFQKLLADGSKDVEGFDSYQAKSLPQGIVGALVEVFRAKHGEEALPVGSLADSADIEHLGMHGVVCNKQLQAVLEVSMGDVESNKRKLAEQPMRSYSWHELTETERSNLTTAIALVNAQEPITIAQVEVCDFRDAKFLGFYRSEREQSVLLAYTILADADKTLEVLVHEVAHKAGGNDGDKSHVANIERIWSGIVRSLRGKP
jgi:hypothetical protein